MPATLRPRRSKQLTRSRHRRDARRKEQASIPLRSRTLRLHRRQKKSRSQQLAMTGAKRVIPGPTTTAPLRQRESAQMMPVTLRPRRSKRLARSRPRRAAKRTASEHSLRPSQTLRLHRRQKKLRSQQLAMTGAKRVIPGPMTTAPLRQQESVREMPSTSRLRQPLRPMK